MENSFLPDNVEHSVSNITKIKKIAFCAIGLIVLILLFYFFFLSSPRNFPAGTMVEIEPGMTLRGVSLKLKNEHIIRSRIAFEAFVIIFGGEKRIVSANYYFKNKLSVYKVVRRIARGEHEMAPISVTIPEGFDVNQIGDVFVGELANFNKSKFLLEAEKLEGYLFPDTYFFSTTDNEENVIKSMSKNFEKKIAPFLPEIISSGKNEKDIIVMASIIEREANGDADRDIISGILWKRISINMPLQVDAAMETYEKRGLPENPIANPGLLSIKASIHPQSSPYLYYLHGKNGNIHYAKSFSEHIKNKLKYLGN